MALRRGRSFRYTGADHWPGFVDALSTLLLVITFLLSVFVLAQHFLGVALQNRDDALARLTSEMRALSEALDLERRGREQAQSEILRLSATLKSERERAAALAAEADALALSLAEKTENLTAAEDQLALFNAQLAELRDQLGALQAALDAAEARDREQQAVIADLGKRLNAALAQKVQELARYRSEFFGRLREILGDRQDIAIVGDRFVFQSELLFDTASAEISPEGRAELAKLAGAVREIAAAIPADIPWVLRVDGHSDARPIATVEFPSNWHLSAARAISVVRYLIAAGVPANRLAAAGFGDEQPLVIGRTEEAFRKNRRIEFKLTER